jgi:hypothetical protein
LKKKIIVFLCCFLLSTSVLAKGKNFPVNNTVIITVFDSIVHSNKWVKNVKVQMLMFGKYNGWLETNKDKIIYKITYVMEVSIPKHGIWFITYGEADSRDYVDRDLYKELKNRRK